MRRCGGALTSETHNVMLHLHRGVFICRFKGHVEVDDYASFTHWRIFLPEEYVVVRDVSMHNPHIVAGESLMS